MKQNQLAFGNIKLRALEPEDLGTIYQWENDPAIWQVSNTHAPFSMFILKQYIEESHRDIFETKQLRLIIENTAGKAVGAIDLFDFDPYHQRAGIGILVYDESDRGQGLATDALELMKKYAVDVLGLHQLYANITTDNPSSIKLFTKAGFKLSGCKKDWIKTPKGWLNEELYQLILSD